MMCRWLKFLYDIFIHNVKDLPISHGLFTMKEKNAHTITIKSKIIYMFQCSGLLRHGCDRKTFEVMASSWSIGTQCSVASLSAATLYQWNYDTNNNIFKIKCFVGCNLKNMHSKINQILRKKIPYILYKGNVCMDGGHVS